MAKWGGFFVNSHYSYWWSCPSEWYYSSGSHAFNLIYFTLKVKETINRLYMVFFFIQYRLLKYILKIHLLYYISKVYKARKICEWSYSHIDGGLMQHFKIRMRKYSKFDTVMTWRFLLRIILYNLLLFMRIFGGYIQLYHKELVIISSYNIMRNLWLYPAIISWGAGGCISL